VPAVRASRDVQGARQETGVVLRTRPSGGVDRTPGQPDGGRQAARGDGRSPRQRRSEWEQTQRQRIADALTENTVSAVVADDPYLLLEILERVQVDVRMH